MKSPRRFSPFRFALAVTMGTWLVLGIALAQQNSGGASTPPPPAPPPPPPVINPFESIRPQGTPTASGLGSFLPQDAYALDWDDHFGPDVFGPFLLPPLPPALGEPRELNPRPLPSDYPEILRDHPGETYFMALGNLRQRKLLSVRRQQRVADYLDARRQAAGALRDQLNQAAGESPARREQLLAEFSASQAAVLQAQEAEAEEIRADLTTNTFFRAAADDISGIGLEPNENAGKNQAQLLAHAALSAGYFQPGLSLEQRLLLQEIADEARLAAGAPAAAGGPYVYFWPAGARMRTPAGISPAVAARLAEFQRLKAELKAELGAAVVREQNFIFVNQRTQAYARLAQAEAPRFSQLDALAEEIRHDLALLPDPAAPPKPDLPADLAQRLVEAGQRKAALQRELAAHLRDFRRDLPADRVELVREAGGAVITAIPRKDVRSQPRLEREAILVRLAAYNADVAPRFAVLTQEYKALRAEIERHQAAGAGAAPGVADVDRLVAGFAEAYAAQENWSRQRDYRAAVLQPGLSPAQRRLLFNAVLAEAFRERYRSVP